MKTTKEKLRFWQVCADQCSRGAAGAPRIHNANNDEFIALLDDADELAELREGLSNIEMSVRQNR